MARPCKVINSQSRHNTKEEIEKRKEAEEAVKGNDDKIIIPPAYLPDEEKKDYEYIINELVDTKILTNVDVYILCKFVKSWGHLRKLEEITSKNPSSIIDSRITKAFETHSKDFYKCVEELSLSPQARAKLGSLALQNKGEREDPIVNALKGDDDE